MNDYEWAMFYIYLPLVAGIFIWSLWRLRDLGKAISREIDKCDGILSALDRIEDEIED